MTVAHQEIELKTDDQIAAMRRAGLVVATALAELAEAAKPGVSTGQLDEIAERVIRAHGAVPSFKGYGYPPFPGSICASVNERVVHGVPRGDEILADGDLLSIDCGAILDGWHGDSAITVPIGAVDERSSELSTVCENAMWAGLAAARPGARLSDISHAVQQSVRTDSRRLLGKGRRYGIVKHYGGHGIGTEMHQDPHILNYGRPGRGPRLMHGMALAIEPMVTLGASETVELADRWTVATRDGSRAAHWEHTVAVTEDGPWVLTAFDGGSQRLGAAASARASTS